MLLAVHLVAMNVASAGPLLCLWLGVRGRRGDEASWAVGKRLAVFSILALLIGVVTGLLLGIVDWFDRSREFSVAIGRFPANAVANFVGEIVFSLACLSIYAAMWNRWRDRQWLHGMFAVLAATNLLYHFPPLMAVIGELATHPGISAEEVITRPVLRSLMLRPEVLSQALHFVFASVAVTGVSMMVMAWRMYRGTRLGSEARLLVKAGARISLVASLAQILIGMWLLFALPPNLRGVLMGDSWPATALFLTAIVVTLGMLHTLATTALGEVTDRNVRRCFVLILSVVLLMTSALRYAQQGHGDGGMSTAVATTSEQSS
jgi:hypothetical protein